ncbi:MAG: hypothetical protein V9H26_04645 [Verrucomicrobiota bacterium]
MRAILLLKVSAQAEALAFGKTAEEFKTLGTLNSFVRLLTTQ